MQRLGQHFLKNKSVIQKIISSIEFGSEDEIFEIGPGHGELTVPLAEICAKTGCSLSAIEKDPKLAQTLAESLPHAKIINGDALDILPELLNTRASKENNYNIVGNIPYYITGHLFRIIGELANRPKRCIFMIQREVAERLCATPPEMNRLAASVQFWASPTIVCTVPKSDFSPPPKVDSAVIMLKTEGNPDGKGYDIEPERYYRAMKALFAQPRKTILNNLSAGLTENHSSQDKNKINTSLIAQNINPLIRPQDLSVGDIVAIAKRYF